MPKIDLVPTRCAICGAEGNAVELYPANLDFEAFNPSVFSARRLPDRIHYRMVKCLVADCFGQSPWPLLDYWPNYMPKVPLPIAARCQISDAPMVVIYHDWIVMEGIEPSQAAID